MRRSRKPAAAPTATQGGAPAQERELRAQGKKTMQKLLQAGVTVFEQRGYHAARVDDIVKVARTSHGTFYLYFSNKEDLLRVLVLDALDEMTALTDELPPVGPGDDGRAVLRDWLERYIEVYDRNGAVLRSLVEAALETREFRRLGEHQLGAFTTALAQRIDRSRSVNGFNPEVAALALLSMIERFSYFESTQQFEFPRQQVVDTLATILHAGLFGNGHHPQPGPSGPLSGKPGLHGDA
jgi:AcrR family transcriptional regulator